MDIKSSERYKIAKNLLRTFVEVENCQMEDYKHGISAIF